MEPKLEVEDIQGHVFPGFGTSHSVTIALRLRNPVAGRVALAGLLSAVTTMADGLREKQNRREAAIKGLSPPEQGAVSLSLSFAATALRSWGYDTNKFDPSFRTGMRAEAGSLGDSIRCDSVPLDWIFNTEEDNQVDVLLIAGHSDREALEQAVARWQNQLEPHLSPVLTEYGRRRQDDKEFFGFKDGISQPAMRGVTPKGEYVSQRYIAAADSRANLYAKPGQLLIWPGAFLFGYPQQTPNPTRAGNPIPPPVQSMRNGSYLVFRRLRQDTHAFREAVRGMAQHLTQLGETVSEEWVAARLVGRWPDGTPLSASPTQANTSISGNPLRINNFRFLASFSPTPLANTENNPQILRKVPADPLGVSCPRASHIRQVNPRDGISEIGQENHPGKLMLRRGIAFGPEEKETPGAERGLLFLAYQTSIVEQFKFVQVNWANAAHRPTGDGIDPIIGQNGMTESLRSIQIFAPSGKQLRCPLHGRWVIATGGDYFITPGVSGLRHLLNAE